MKKMVKGAALCCTVLLSACDETVLHDLQEREAINAVFDLQSAGIPARKERSAAGWSIAVKQKNLAEATAVLREYGTLRGSGEKEAAPGFIWNRADRLHRREQEIATKLEQTLEALPGVLDARLNLILKDSRTFVLHKDTTASSASAVLVITDSFRVAEEDLVRILRGATAIPSSAIEIVLVADTRFGNERERAGDASVGESPLKDFWHPELLLYLLISTCSTLVVIFFLYLRRSQRRRRKEFARKAQRGVSTLHHQLTPDGPPEELIQ